MARPAAVRVDGPLDEKGLISSPGQSHWRRTFLRLNNLRQMSLAQTDGTTGSNFRIGSRARCPGGD